VSHFSFFFKFSPLFCVAMDSNLKRCQVNDNTKKNRENLRINIKSFILIR
jgi:hypothetical protein